MIANLLIFFIVIQYVAAILIIPQTLSLIAFSAAVTLVGAAAFALLSRSGACVFRAKPATCRILSQWRTINAVLIRCRAIGSSGPSSAFGSRRQNVAPGRWRPGRAELTTEQPAERKGLPTGRSATSWREMRKTSRTVSHADQRQRHGQPKVSDFCRDMQYQYFKV